MRTALALLAALALAAPAGAASTRVRGVPYPTNLAFDAAGGLWISSSAGGSQASDGIWYAPRGARTPRHVIRGIHLVLGLAWHGGRLFVSHAPTPSIGRVSSYGGWDGRRFRSRRTVIERLRIGLHAVNSIAPGRDGRLYVGAGSSADHSGFPGRIVSVRPDGSGLRREAVGLRNPYGLAFVPGTDRLLVTDHGRDDLGAFRPPEELDALAVGGAVEDFGWPSCWGRGGGSGCAGTLAPLVTFPAHAASSGLAVAEDWAGAGPTAFVAEFGSSFAANPTGSDVRRVWLGGRPRQRVFASGFREHDPLGAAIGPDGALYVSLFFSGKVVRYPEGAKS